nr:ANTAR domain-containing protein [Nocardioides sp. InS609-2]
MSSQPVIDQAKGVLMFGYGVDADTAFGLLMRWSQNTNTKVRDLAAALVLSLSNGTGDLPALARVVEQVLRRATPHGQEPAD